MFSLTESLTMGEIRNISIRTVAALAMAFAVASVGVAAADPAGSPAAVDADVSASTLGETAPEGKQSAGPTTPAESALPLTRAASQQRIEHMSPVDWMRRFGDVTVGRVD